jgi:integrase
MRCAITEPRQIRILATLRNSVASLSVSSEIRVYPVLKPKSMSNDGQLLKQFLAWCTDRQLIEHNPLASQKFRPPKAEPREGPNLMQINAILKHASATRYPVLATLAFTGARSGEVAHLRVEDVDLSGNWLHFVSRPGFETKTGESRKVPIHTLLRPVVEQALAQSNSGWLFTALPSRKFPQGGHHISTKRVNEDFLKVLKHLKLPAGRDGGFTIHSLRRSFKTICVNSRIPREVVDAWQGHTRIRTASDLYYKLSDSDSQLFMKQVPFGNTK